MNRRDFLKQLAIIPFAPLLPELLIVDTSPFAMPDTYEILSPSQVYFDMGQNIISGLQKGIQTSQELIEDNCLGGFIVPDYLAKEIWKNVRENTVLYKKVGITIE